MFLTKVFLLPVMIKVLTRTGKPLMCAILYALGILTNGLIFDIAAGTTFGHVALIMTASFAMSYGYFFLLKDLEGAGTPYWTVLIGGLGLILWWPN